MPKLKPPTPAPAHPDSGAIERPVHTRSPADGFESLAGTEWLLTNGLGGYAMGTAAGLPTRRYHALLAAATSPPVGRIVALSAMVEQLIVGTPGESVPPVVTELSTFRFKGIPPVVHPRGVDALVGFEYGPFARWVFSTPGLVVTKQVTLHRGVNAVSITYTLTRSGVPKAGSGKGAPPALPATLTIRPLVALRDFHALGRRWSSDRFSTSPTADGVEVALDGRTVSIKSDGCGFTPESQWWYDFFYAIEAERGQDCLEDLYSPGAFTLTLPPGRAEIACTIRACVGPVPTRSVEQELAAGRGRFAGFALAAMPGTPSAEDRLSVSALVGAADDFVVARCIPPEEARDASGVSIIAGYPWFSDWGRDTFVSLPGLLLETGRTDEARRTLLAFAKARRNGIIPNVFNDQTGEPEFNTVDASLWFIHAVCAYAAKTNDQATWNEHLKPACLDIVDHYRRGTDFNIAMDPKDKLLTAGSPATQLTWMDARRDGVVFTPRHGKPVEINALWYSGLRSLSQRLAGDDPVGAANLGDLSEAVGRSFRASFWNAAEECLFDCLVPGNSGDIPASEIRPNQVFGVSLPHSPLTIEQQRAVLNVLKSRLLTPMGLRTLAPGSPGYRGRYQGNLFDRDGAYHNGTAWPWLLGAYAEGVLRVGSFSKPARAEARGVLEPLIGQIRSGKAPIGACLGQIAEIFDGDAPQRPQGCTAQAWSVAEILRVFLLTIRQ